MSKPAVTVDGDSVLLGTAVVATLERELDDWTVRECGGAAIGFIYVDADAKYHCNGRSFPDLCSAVTSVIQQPGKLARSKYNNQKTEVDGIVFDSKHEAKRYRELKLMEAGKLISKLELQPRFVIVINGVKVCTYVGDFRYEEAGGTVVEDAKGMRTAMYRLKKKLVNACFGIVIKEV